MQRPQTPQGSSEPGLEVLKGVTLYPHKRGEDQRPVQTTQAASKRAKTWLLPPAAVSVLGESATAYHKLVEFERRADLSLKHYRLELEARLRGAGIGPNGEMINKYPASQLPPVLRIMQLCIHFQQEPSADPMGPTRWTLRLWGRFTDEEEETIDLTRYLARARIEIIGSNPPVAVDWVSQNGRATHSLTIQRATMLGPEVQAMITVHTKQSNGPSQAVYLMKPLAEFLHHPPQSMVPFRQVVEMVWGIIKEQRLHEPERKNAPRGSTIALRNWGPLMRLLGLPPEQNPEFIALHDVMKLLRAHVREAVEMPLQMLHHLKPADPTQGVYEVQVYDMDPLMSSMHEMVGKLKQSTGPRANGELNALDAQLRSTLDQLRQHSLKRTWLRALLYEPTSSASASASASTSTPAAAPAAAPATATSSPAGTSTADAAGTSTADAGGTSSADAATPPPAAADGASAASTSSGVAPAGTTLPDSKLRSLKDFAKTLLDAQLHVTSNALTPAQLRPANTPGLTDEVLKNALKAYLRGAGSG